MSDLEEDEAYGDLEDEDFIENFGQASQSLPPHPAKRKAYDSDDTPNYDGPAQGSDDEDKRPKKKYKIHIGQPVPEAKIICATQAENMPDSSPYRIRGPIYTKPRARLSPESLNKRTSIYPNGRLTSFFKAAGDSNRRTQANDDFAQQLQDLPEDAFSDEEFRPISIGSSSERGSIQQLTMARDHVVAPRANLKQSTLFGGRATQAITASQAKRVHNYKVDQTPEPPTHHTLDQEALKTWVYPTNLGATRDYQHSIVRNGLFNNLLVALPTGLGKTFIAATVMLNFFRWTKDAKIVFVAPTKPLVAQQVTACFNIVGIPRSTTTMLTGEQAPGLRAEEWAQKRVFFMTPQTLENDLTSGIADPKSIVLLVIDEAHRATGNYAYVRVVSFLRRFNQSFRILALTATPGSNVEQVQQVIDSLEIAKIDIRTEESIDIQQYVHQRRIEEIVLEPSCDIIMVKELLAKALQPLVNLLCSQNAFYNRDPMALTTYGLMQAQKNWVNSGAGRNANQGLKRMIRSLFSTLASVAHCIKLLDYHGIRPFYSTIKDFRQLVEDGGKGGKYRAQVVTSPEFVKMMDRVRDWLSKDDFVGHPKLTYLCDTVLNHFLDAGEGRLPDGAPPSSTRVIVFAEFRDSAEDIARFLNRHGPMIRASVFVGQADSARSAGMNQAKQLETINKFKAGGFNVIVATCIGEEGLDIGQVDLIVCYDSSKSPVRMLQRMGRTGRKRAGNVVCLLMRGKEEDSFAKSKDNYQKMQEMICKGERFSFRHDLSRRIVPKEFKPTVEKKMIEIPVENTQDSSLPEPRKRVAKKKLPAKKFHMPDGVETGFRKASKLTGDGKTPTRSSNAREAATYDVVHLPPLDIILLNPAQERELQERYQKIGGQEFEEEVSMPDFTTQTLAQRTLTATGNVPHGNFTKRCVRLFGTLAASQQIEDRYIKPYGEEEPGNQHWDTTVILVNTNEAVNRRPVAVELAPSKKRRQAPKRIVPIMHSESDMEGPDEDEIPGGCRTQTQMPSSEGPGEDLIVSETPSDDSLDEPSSLDDFLAQEDGDRGVDATSSTLSSTTPAPAASKSTLQTQEIQASDSEDDNMPHGEEIINSSQQFVPSSDAEEFKAPRGRRAQQRLVED